MQPYGACWDQTQTSPDYNVTTINNLTHVLPVSFPHPKGARVLERNALVRSFLGLLNLKPLSPVDNCSDHPKAATQAPVRRRQATIKLPKRPEEAGCQLKYLPEDSNRPSVAAGRPSCRSANREKERFNKAAGV